MSRISKSLLTLLGASFFIVGGCGDDSGTPTAPGHAGRRYGRGRRSSECYPE
jgi:hypothetical protein